MKKVLLTGVAMALLTGSALAADLPRRAAPPPVFVPPPPVFTWTGVYIGTHTSYSFADNYRVRTVGNNPLTQFVIDSGFIPASVNKRGDDGFANFGGGFGINYQLTPGSGFVIGAAVDADWTDLHRTTVVEGAVIPLFGTGARNAYSQELGWLATANGRVGYAFDRLLVYGTGGAAIGHVKYGYDVSFKGVGLVGSGSAGANEVGFNYGGGVEYAIPTDSFLGNLSLLKLAGINLGGTTTLKAEYIHYDLGSRRVLTTDLLGLGGSASTRFRTEGDMVRFGLTYKFP